MADAAARHAMRSPATVDVDAAHRGRERDDEDVRLGHGCLAALDAVMCYLGAVFRFTMPLAVERRPGTEATLCIAAGSGLIVLRSTVPVLGRVGCQVRPARVLPRG